MSEFSLHSLSYCTHQSLVNRTHDSETIYLPAMKSDASNELCGLLATRGVKKRRKRVNIPVNLVNLL